MDNKIRQEMEKIEIPKELTNRVILGVENAKKDNKRHKQLKPESKSDRKRWSLRKRIMFISSVAVLLFGLFISSAFVSPAMAKVISNIPYLGLIFQSEPINNLIFDELEEKGYKISGTGISYKPKKELEVRVEGSYDYFNEVKDDIEKTVKGILKSKGYDAYSVKVSKEQAQNDYVLNEEEMKEKTILDNQVTKKLKQLDYKFDLVQTDPKEKIIFIDMGGSKKYYDSVKSDVEKIAIDVTELNDYKDYSIDVNRSTVKIEKADTGALITPAIAEGLMSKKEFKVTGVGYKEKPLNFIISTSIPSSDPEAKVLGTEIESMIVEFLKSEEISSILGKESYEIIVKSKDKKRIN